MSHGRPWTADDGATLSRMANAGYSDGEIAQHMKRDRDLIGRKRRQMDIQPGQSPSLTMMMARINARKTTLTFLSRSFA